MLNFGAVYFNSEVYLDGILVGRHFGGSSSFSFDITRFVEDGLEHHLTVRASSDLRSTMQSAGKQSLLLNSHGCQYTRTTGIWQTVWLEAVAPTGLQSVHVLTDIDQKQLVIHPRFYIENSGHMLRIALQEGRKAVGTVCVKAANSSVAVFSLKNVKLWSPESPFLYDVVYQVLDRDGTVVDEVVSYVGMRKVHIEGNRIYLNNEPCYQRLVLDQGFYPDGIWTAPSDEALKNDIELSLAAGFNGARLHQKALKNAFIIGLINWDILPWGEAPSWGMDANSVEVARNFLQEWSELVLRDRNHPSIFMWSIGNEVLEQWTDAKADTLSLEEANLVLNFGHSADMLAKDGEMSVNSLLTKKLADMVRKLDANAPRDGRLQRAEPQQSLFVPCARYNRF